MHLKMKKILSILFISFLASSISVGFAWGWHLPIRPGDHVIDIVRLNKSAEITAKAMTIALQTYQLYENRIASLLPTETINEVNSALQDVRVLENQLLLSGPIRNDVDAWVAFKNPTSENLSADATFAQNIAMRTVQDNANYDAVNVIRTHNDKLQKMGKEINRLAGVNEHGNLGQQQVGINQRSLMLQMMIDNLYTEAATDIATETKTKGDIAREKIAIRQGKDLLINTYDPFNRTEQDNTLHPKSPALGYPRF